MEVEVFGWAPCGGDEREREELRRRGRVAATLERNNNS